MYVLAVLLGGTFSATVLKFDTTQNTWNEVAQMPRTRFAHAACILGGDTYVLGGCDDKADQQDSAFKYDTKEDAWTTLAPMPSPCAFHGATTLDGQIYPTGVGERRKKVLLFDNTLGLWSKLAPTLSSRQQGSLFVLDGCVHAVGGHPNVSSVERYDAGTDTWMAVADMLEGRRVSGAVTISAGGPVKEQNLFNALIAKATRYLATFKSCVDSIHKQRK
jgi:hypothetical protein